MLRSLLHGALRSGAMSSRRGGYGGTTGGYGRGGGMGSVVGLASRFLRRR